MDLTPRHCGVGLPCQLRCNCLPMNKYTVHDVLSWSISQANCKQCCLERRLPRYGIYYHFGSTYAHSTPGTTWSMPALPAGRHMVMHMDVAASASSSLESCWVGGEGLRIFTCTQRWATRVRFGFMEMVCRWRHTVDARERKARSRGRLGVMQVRSPEQEGSQDHAPESEGGVVLIGESGGATLFRIDAWHRFVG